MVKIVVAADICPIGINLPLFVAGDAQALFTDLLPHFQTADLVIANLECPLTRVLRPIQKTGPCFSAPPEAIRAVKNAGINVLSLANNHILDQGPEGLLSTLEVCAAHEIAAVGAGSDLASAGALLIREVKGLRIGIMALAEHEFSIAGLNTPGANPLDLIENVRLLLDQRASLDYIVVLLHGSHEFHAPTPRIQKTCRFFIEIGADAIFVQHPHCLGGIETYRDKPIIYGSGALVMDEELYRTNSGFHQGFLTTLGVESRGTAALDIIPFVQSDPLPGARRLAPDREAEFRSSIKSRSARLTDPSLVRAEWADFCAARANAYLGSVLGHGRILRKLNRRGWITKFFYRRQAMLSARNAFNCQTHREAIQTILNENLF